jgi:hypothetical protein
MATVRVNVDDFVRAETARMFDGILAQTPGINDVAAKRGEDGSVTIDLAPASNGFRNHIYIMDGWNYAFRLYRPRAADLDGTWQLPAIERVG